MRNKWGLFAAVLCLAALAGAQVNSGVIVGSVHDSSGAAIAGATVTVTNNATNVAVKTASDSAGAYQVLSLIPGTYTVKAEAKGFAPQQAENVPINVQSRQLVNFTLPVGTVMQQAEVVATQPLLETQSANAGGVVNAQQIVDLPLNGRRYSDLALLQPGVAQDPQTEVANPAPDRMNVDGNSELQNYFTLDGTDNNSYSENLQENSVQAVHPPPDALSEFRVQTRTYTAEFGTSAGAVINASIKSGADQFHGDLWDFLRNNDLDSNTFFNNRDGIPNGHFSQNQFGGTIGGPIVKNNTFFFVDAQGLISRQATTETATVPTPLMKEGNFTELSKTLTAVVPSQAGCISGNIISTTQPGCIDPVGQKLVDLYPDPNIPSEVALEGIPGSFNDAPNYQYVYSVPNNTYSTDVRIDHTINNSNQIFGRYSYENQNYQDAPWTSNLLIGNGNFATSFLIHDQSVALGWTDTLSPSTVNQFHFGWSRVTAHSDPLGVALGESQASTYGLNGIPVGPNSSGLPPMYISSFQTIGTSEYRPQSQIEGTWQYVETLNTIKGNHSYQFGYEYHRAADALFDIQAPQGLTESTGIYSGDSGFGLADYLMGNVSEAIFTTPLVAHNYYPGHAVYAQDTWRATSNLTITYGLRYELFFPVLNRQNQMSNFSPENGGTIISSTCCSVYDRALVHPQYNNFAPRFGLDYHMLSNLVWRGGYGIFYQHLNRIGSESMLDLNPPFMDDAVAVQNLGSTTPVFQLQNGFPISSLNSLSAVNMDTLQIRAQDPNQATPYVEQASFGPELQLNQNTVLDITGVGNWGRHEERLRNANQGVMVGTDPANGEPIIQFPYANLNSVLESDDGTGQHAFLELSTNDGNSDYAALDTSLRRQYSGGFAYQFSYTWSHGMSDYVDNLTGAATPADAYNYGLEMSNSPFDVRQRFVANAIWDLPVGKGKHFLNNDSVASKILGGWQANTILSLQTGIPFGFTAPDESFTGSSHASRPDCNGNILAGATTNPSALVNFTGFYMNPAAFSDPAAGDFGTCAPRMLHGPGIENEDFSLFRTVQLTESKRLEIRGEFFNVWNHVNFANPVGSITNSDFGYITSTVGNPRQIQLALKLYF